MAALSQAELEAFLAGCRLNASAIRLRRPLGAPMSNFVARRALLDDVPGSMKQPRDQDHQVGSQALEEQQAMTFHLSERCL